MGPSSDRISQLTKKFIQDPSQKERLDAEGVATDGAAGAGAGASADADAGSRKTMEGLLQSPLIGTKPDRHHLAPPSCQTAMRLA